MYIMYKNPSRIKMTEELVALALAEIVAQSN
jgi:hypothetical protein